MSQSKDLYRIFWKNQTTGATGHGEPISKASADAWVGKANKEHPDIHHWAEPV